MQFDWTIHIIDVIIVPVIALVLHTAIVQRDFNRRVLDLLGQARPPGSRYGLLGDMEMLKEAHASQKETLIEIRHTIGHDKRRGDDEADI